MPSDKTRLQFLVSQAKKLGLHKTDISYAQDFLDQGEHFLCFDQVVTQLYELGISIDQSFYLSVEALARKWKLNDEEYAFLKENILSGS